MQLSVRTITHGETDARTRVRTELLGCAHAGIDRRALDDAGHPRRVLGRRRFDQIQESLGVARNVLSSRLQLLVDEGILEKRVYQSKPERHEYFLTEKGLDLWPILVALIGFGDKHLSDPEGAAASRSATRAATGS